MNRIAIFTGIASLALAGILTLSACGPATPEPSPTVDIAAAQTSAVGTFAAGLTQTAFALPSDTPTLLPTETPASATPQGTPLPTQVVSLPTASCYGLTYVKDVTIPDNTAMTPGQTFTKTWRVRNSGSCDWEAGFKFALIGGDAMSGATLVLDSAVKPGVEKDLSIAMKAPTTVGSARGTWRMSTAGGNSFGDQVFVLITVGGTTTVTPTVTRTGTLSVTPTKTGTTAVTATTAATTVVPTATASVTPVPPTDTPTEAPTTGP